MNKKTLLPDVILTVPNKESKYMVTDEQIDLMCKSGKDSSLDWAMALFGASLGLANHFVFLIVAVVQAKTVPNIHLFFALCFVGCATAFVAKYFEYRKTSSEIEKLAASINRGRKVNISENVVEMSKQ